MAYLSLSLNFIANLKLLSKRKEKKQFWRYHSSTSPTYMVPKTVLGTDYRTFFSAYFLSDTVLRTFLYVNSINPHNNLEREVLLSTHFVDGKTETERVSTLPRYT